jgi:prepilin-type N-terminal cleavage/methylation domain-containing protein
MRPPDHPPGFTLVELLVALVVLSVGVLGLAGSARLLLRQATWSAVRARAASLADVRFELVAAGGCAVAAGGSRDVDGIAEAWSVRRDGRALVVTDTLRFRAGRELEVLAFERVLLCVP